MNKKKKSSKTQGKKFSLTPEIGKKEKTKRAKYLTKRINDFFENLKDWIEGVENFSLKKSNIGIEGEKLPAADILSGNKSFLTIKPNGLYSFGVNCRLDLVSSKEINILLDIAKESDPADWQLISAEAGKKPKKLTKMIFRNLLKKLSNK
jgi:hypothetical protein